ncbi:MAG: NADPH-dependent oxidoreductase [Chitinophagaceae bacterium]|nr:MAG: NADPH-dependent oxidoreductase [Chitinophagaceae bacterium]
MFVQKIENMILLLNGTNRKDSRTSIISGVYRKILDEKKIDYCFFSLEDLPKNFLSNTMYEKRDPEWQKLMESYIFPAEKIILVAPEYNGSFPGILKLFIDSSDVKKSFHGKKVSLTGVAAGRAGNLRGMEHLSGIFLHLKMSVFHNRLPLSSIENLLDDNGLKDDSTLKLIEKQIDDFLMEIL